VIRSGKRVIISTGTKNLQEQLFLKDIPFLEQALFPAAKAS
jgi:ATP-dependent DNA helicase DinG